MTTSHLLDQQSHLQRKGGVVLRPEVSQDEAKQFQVAAVVAVVGQDAGEYRLMIS